jgi:hypothetical protein
MDMRTSIDQTVVVQKFEKLKPYGSEFEKKLRVDNLRWAVEIYGKDRLRKGFNIRKRQNARF